MNDGLKCQVPGCRTVIYAFTGLQELEKLRRHMARAHLLTLTLDQALDWRVRFEAQQAERDAEPGRRRSPRFRRKRG